MHNMYVLYGVYVRMYGVHTYIHTYILTYTLATPLAVSFHLKTKPNMICDKLGERWLAAQAPSPKRSPETPAVCIVVIIIVTYLLMMMSQV